MKKIFYSLSVMLTLIMLFTLSSCRKFVDYFHDHPDAHDTLCRITRIACSGYSGYPDTFNVTYNAKGNPISLLEQNPGTRTDDIDQYFRYDRYDRLTDYLYTFTGSHGVLVWHKYGYPRKNFVTDTTIGYTGLTDGPAPIADSNSRVIGYTLDANGKIIKTWAVLPHLPPQDGSDVVYDANGNLPVPFPDVTQYSYDDKVNVYRTNKIWQFVYNDYSRNNMILDDHFFFPTYNEFGLPLSIRNLETPYATSHALFNLVYTSPSIDIEYACTVPHGPGGY